MSGLNKATLIGRVGNDPDIKHTGDGTPLATFSLATSETYKDRNGNKQEKTAWHNIVIWRKLAEIVGQYVKKGALLYLEGKITYEEYEKDGVKRKATKIVCNHMLMLGGKSQNGNSTSGSGSSGGSRGAPDPDFTPEFEEDDIPT